MENIIVYLIVIVVVVVNILRNYKKEQKKNKVRKATQQNKPIVDRPFSKKRIEKVLESAEVLANTISTPIIEYDTLENSYIKDQQKSYMKIDELNYQVEDHFGEAFEQVEDSKAESCDLRLGTPNDLKTAIVHTLIFERKYQ